MYKNIFFLFCCVLMSSCISNELNLYNNKLYIVKTLEGKEGLINNTGKVILKPIYHSVRFNTFSQDVIALSDNSLFVFNEKGEGIFELQGHYESYAVCGLSDTLLAVSDIGRCEIYNYITGAKLISCKNYKSSLGTEPITAIQIDDLWGYLGGDGELITEIIYDDIESFYKYGKVCLNGKWGLVNKHSDLIIECKYEDIKNRMWPKDKGYVVKENGRWRLLSQNINIPDNSFEEIKIIREDLVLVIKDGQPFLLFDGNKSYPCDFETAFSIEDTDLLTVGTANKMWITDLQGKRISSNTYYLIDHFSNGLARAVMEGQEAQRKFGFIDLNGNYVIPPQFYSGGSFSEGLAFVEFHNGEEYLAGYINRHGELLIKTYESKRYSNEVMGRPFKDGLAWIETPEQQGYINKSGKWVWKVERK